MRDVAFISVADKVLVGWGPFSRSRSRTPGRLAFYINDYFQSVIHPWVYPESFEVLSADEATIRLGAGSKGVSGVLWEAADRQLFDRLFDDAHALIDQGLLQKAVVLSKQLGILPEEWKENPLSAVVQRLKPLFRPGLQWYGFQESGIGFAGLTPETLFETRDGMHVESAALAGTVRSGAESGFDSDLKQRGEHLLVARDIAERLAPLGDVHVAPLSVVPFGHLSHLRSVITCTSPEILSFETLCTALHPTAALGVYPRTAIGRDFLRCQESLLPRGFHGAPFGFEQEVAAPRSRCLVAIRNVQWDASVMSLVGGAGVVEQSSRDSEWEECELKRSHLRKALSVEPISESSR